MRASGTPRGATGAPRPPPARPTRPSPLGFPPPLPSPRPRGGGAAQVARLAPPSARVAPASPPPPFRPPRMALRLRARGWRSSAPRSAVGAVGRPRPRWAAAPAAPRPPVGRSPLRCGCCRAQSSARRPPPLLPALRRLRRPPGRPWSAGRGVAGVPPAPPRGRSAPPPPSARVRVGFLGEVRLGLPSGSRVSGMVGTQSVLQ